MITVNFQKLKYCLGFWRETFSDCACCPLYPFDCEGTNEDEELCVKRITHWLTDLDEIVKPQ